MDHNLYKKVREDQDEGFDIIELKITDASLSIPEADYDRLSDLSYNGIMIDPVEAGDNAVPWDAWISIEDGLLKLHGAAGPSGFGKVEVEIPANSAKDLYKIYIEPKDVASVEEIKAILSKYNLI
jgi:hypothetical protein